MRVTGIGGVFFKGKDAERTRAWYEKHLGIPASSTGYAFGWTERDDPNRKGMTIFSIFEHETDYFAPSTSPFMINFRVADLDAVLNALRAEGVEVDDKIEDSPYGKFGWIMDPDGNRVELWQPPEA